MRRSSPAPCFPVAPAYFLGGLGRAGEDHQYRPRLLFGRALCRQAGEAFREARARAGHFLCPRRRTGAAGGADQAGGCQHPELRAHPHRRRAGQARGRLLQYLQSAGEQRDREREAHRRLREARHRGQDQAAQGAARRHAVGERLGRKNARRAGEKIRPHAAGRHQQRLSRRRSTGLRGGVLSAS